MNGSRTWMLLCGVVVLVACLELNYRQALASGSCLFQSGRESGASWQRSAELRFPRLIEHIDVFNNADDKKPLGLSIPYCRDFCVGKDSVAKCVPHGDRPTLDSENAFGFPAERWKG